MVILMYLVNIKLFFYRIGSYNKLEDTYFGPLNEQDGRETLDFVLYE